MTIEYVPLHCHSTFSHGDGYGTPKQHVERAAELGYSATALTEHGGVSSFFQFEKSALKSGVKPIFGVEAYCEIGGTPGQLKNHLTILAMNQEGYRNLNELVTQSWKDYYYKPTVTGRNLAKHNQGLIVLSGCTGSKLACDLVGGKDRPDHVDSPDLEMAMGTADSFRRLLGDRYFLEVQAFPGLQKTCVINPAYAIIGRELGIPLVATMDIHYPMPEDNEMQVILHAAHRGGNSFETQAESWEYDILLTYPQSDKAVYDDLIGTGLSFREADEAIESTIAIAKRCGVTLPKSEPLRYPIQESDLSKWT
jgi:DNA polymerase-3 subunit alpha